MTRIRPFRGADEAAIGEVCVRTAWAGADATGRYSDDTIWPTVFAWPYVARHPDLAFVVESDDGRVVGYLVATPETRPFERWFREEWWPSRGARWPHPSPDDDSAEAATLRYAAARGSGDSPYSDEYPAHLHIDLLPEAQGAGWGRRLIGTALEALDAAGATGVHLVAGAENSGALAFYPRVGFTALPSQPGEQAFGRALGR